MVVGTRFRGILLAVSCWHFLVPYASARRIGVHSASAGSARDRAQPSNWCKEKCESSMLYGRWKRDAVYAHICLMTSTGGEKKKECLCTESEDTPAECEGSALTVLAASKGAKSVTARDTVNDLCDKPALREMRGADSPGGSAADRLENAILGDIAHELESNNVDQMAKEIFTFYVCVRWIPDKTFWQVAEQELTANLVQSVVNHSQSPHQAIAELYQRYKFVPLLCSNNLEVFGGADPTDGTHFTRFKRDVKDMSDWLRVAASSRVGRRLQGIDEVFCQNDQMNSRGCETILHISDVVNQATSRFGIRLQHTHENKWKTMEALFKSFDAEREEQGAFSADISDWRQRFPHHSFINKPEGMPVEASPTSNERFVVCFGKRVASELHRRPSGQHILTDQNNVGCHGWYTTEMAASMLDRIVKLWRPPTCQLADMVYHMKKDILSKFRQMNERLFDALPTMLIDEELQIQAQSEQGLGLSAPAQQLEEGASLTLDGVVFVDKMRAAATATAQFPPGCFDPGWFHNASSQDAPRCVLHVSVGDLGSLVVDEHGLGIRWDKDKAHNTYPAAPRDLRVMPHGWTGTKGMSSYISDVVAGVRNVTDKANMLFSSMFSRQHKIAAMMSSAVAKWIVCPVRQDLIGSKKLDDNLGVEDAAFQDFRKEAYAKWTGYKAKVPGEECQSADFIPQTAPFKGSKACEISELYADHVEKFFDDEHQQIDFICPMKPALPFDEQLTILAAKRNTCFLRMTPQQSQHNNWHYAGHFPAHLQNQHKENMPSAQFELVKLLKVPEGHSAEVSFGRWCSLEELTESPRFCKMPKLHNPWPTVEEMAEELAGSVAGALGVGVHALNFAIQNYRKGVHNASERAKKAALALTENTVDALFGAGRLVASLGHVAATKATRGLPGAGRRSNRLEEQLFGSAHGGELLHSMSFQRDVGRNAESSKPKLRFQRYVVSSSCDFDPGLLFSLRRNWGDVALHMLREAAVKLSKSGIFTRPSLQMQLRGEAVLYENPNDHSGNATWFTYGAAMHVPGIGGTESDVVQDTLCKGSVMGCRPKDVCEWSLRHMKCVAKTNWNPAAWFPVDRDHLRKVVGALRISGGQASLSGLGSLQLQIHCGKKREFGQSGLPAKTLSDESLLDCVRRGVEHNARLQAREPWRLYFPDEIVVVAMFTELEDSRKCQPADGISEALRGTLCAPDARVVDDLVGHLSDSILRPRRGVFRGVHSGSGIPKGTPEEVVLRPEDVLEALRMLIPTEKGYVYGLGTSGDAVASVNFLDLEELVSLVDESCTKPLASGCQGFCYDAATQGYLESCVAVGLAEPEQIDPLAPFLISKPVIVHETCNDLGFLTKDTTRGDSFFGLSPEPITVYATGSDALAMAYEKITADPAANAAVQDGGASWRAAAPRCDLGSS